MQEYAWFNIPKNFSNGMFADKARWAQDTSIQVTCTIVRAISGIVVPRILDFEAWRDHATEFFRRLCAHRRAMHGRWNKAMSDFSRRQGTTAEKLLELEHRLAAVEARMGRGFLHAAQATSGSASQGQRFSPPRGRAPPGSPREGRASPAISRERSIPERILDAQLEAIGKRSDSPGPDALRALEAFREAHGPLLPPSCQSAAPAHRNTAGQMPTRGALSATDQQTFAAVLQALSAED